MIAFENVIDIARPPAAVFAYLADLEHIPEWNWAIASTTKMTPGPVAVGTRFRQVRTTPRQQVETLEVTRFVPGRILEIEGELASLRARLSYEVTETAEGSRLTNRVALDVPGLMGLVGGVLGGRIQASVAQNLETLRDILEKPLVRGRSGQVVANYSRRD